jgi:hypothetical protein
VLQTKWFWIYLHQALGATGGFVFAASKFSSFTANERAHLPVLLRLCNVISKIVGAKPSIQQHILALRSVMKGVFNQNRQEDAHEFLLALINKCELERGGYLGEGMCSHNAFECIYCAIIQEEQFEQANSMCSSAWNSDKTHFVSVQSVQPKLSLKRHPWELD